MRDKDGPIMPDFDKIRQAARQRIGDAELRARMPEVGTSSAPASATVSSTRDGRLSKRFFTASTCDVCRP
jgi:hypothetical protein